MVSVMAWMILYQAQAPRFRRLSRRGTHLPRDHGVNACQLIDYGLDSLTLHSHLARSIDSNAI